MCVAATDPPPPPADRLLVSQCQEKRTKERSNPCTNMRKLEKHAKERKKKIIEEEEAEEEKRIEKYENEMKMR